MAITFNKSKLIPRQYQVLILPVLFLVIIALLLIFVLKFGIAQISSEQDKVNAINTSINALTAKETTLSEIQSSAISQVNVAVNAIPEKNPLLVAISQIKNVATQNGLSVSKIEAGGAPLGETGLSFATINFDVEGNTSSILNFAKSISSSAPLTTIEKLSMSQSSSSGLAEISLKIYWAPFPVKLPSETETLNGLTSDDQKTIAKLQALQPPPYNSQLSPEAPQTRANPFGF